jgi:hypothetical protein
MPCRQDGQRIVIAPGLALLLLLAAAEAVAAPSDQGPSDQTGQIRFAQLTIRQSIIVRVPATALAPNPPAIRWKEKKGPRCIAMQDVAGAAIIEKDRVDLILKGGARIRAAFASSCPALDYYSGFYMVPSADADICAGRDSIHTRAGGECQIARFRKLVPGR